LFTENTARGEDDLDGTGNQTSGVELEISGIVLYMVRGTEVVKERLVQVLQ
jgi:hypothetical protein